MTRLGRPAGILLATCVATALLLSACAKEEEQLQRVGSTPVQVTVTAAKLVSEYHANEVASDVAYKDKVIQVTGPIVEIKKDLGGHPVVILMPNKQKPFQRVRCVYGKAAIAKTATYAKGQTVSIKGICQGKFGTINLSACTPVD